MATNRPAERHEGRDILELYQASFRAFGPDAYDEAQVRAWAATDEPDYPIQEPDHRFVVAERADELAGFGDLHWPESEITALYVHPEHARMGVGAAILEAARTGGP